MHDERELRRSDPQRLLHDHGVFRWADAQVLGVPTLRGGQVPGQRVLPGIWCLLEGCLDTAARDAAAVLYGGPGAALTGLCAARLRGWTHERYVRRRDVAVPWPTDKVDQPGVRLHRTRLVDAVQVDGLAVTSCPRTLLDVARLDGAEALAGVLACAVQRREVSLEQLDDFLRAHPRLPGARTARRVAEELAGGIGSKGELDLVRSLRRAGMGHFEPQVEIWDGDLLITIADVLWREGAAGFFDGAHHLSSAAREGDARKTLLLESRGIAVVRVTSALVRDDRLLRAAFADALRRADSSRWTRVAPRRIQLHPLPQAAG